MPDAVMEQTIPEPVGIERDGETEHPELDLLDAKEKIRKLALKRFKHGYDYDRDDREAAQEDQRFRKGDQWNEKYESERKAAGLPCLKSNRMNTFVNQVTGDARQNRPAIDIVPGDMAATDDVADIFEGKIREIINSSYGDVAFDHAHDSAAGCGRGYFRVVNRYRDDEGFEQTLAIERVADCFSVVEDPAATKFDNSDGMWKFVCQMIPRDEYEARWPEASTTNFDNLEHSYRQYWYENDMVRVAEYWWKEPGETYTLYQYADGTKSREKLKDLNGQTVKPVRSRQVRKMVVKWCIMSGAEILEGPFEWIGRHIPIIPVWGQEIYADGKRTTFGVVRQAKDEQRRYNYGMSVEAEMLVKAPKQPWILTKKMIQGNEGYWNTIDRYNRTYVLYNPDTDAPGLKPYRDRPIEVQPGLQQTQINAVQGMKDTTGIQDPGLGKAVPSVTSGEQAKALQQETDTGTFLYTDNLSRALCYLGEILVDLIPKFYPDFETLRLMKEDGTVDWQPVNEPVYVDAMTGDEVPQSMVERYVSLNPMAQLEPVRVNNSLTDGRYDVVVTTGPSYKTKRIEDTVKKTELIRTVPSVFPIVGDLLIKDMDFKDSDEMSRRIKATIPPNIIAAGEGRNYADQMPQLDPVTGQPVQGLVDQNGNPMQAPQPGMG